MVYNISQVQGYSLYEFLSGANILSGGLLSGLFLVTLFFVAFISMKRFESKVAFSSASFITVMIAILFRVMNWISDLYLFSTFFLLIVSYVWLSWGD